MSDPLDIGYGDEISVTDEGDPWNPGEWEGGQPDWGSPGDDPFGPVGGGIGPRGPGSRGPQGGYAPSIPNYQLDDPNFQKILTEELDYFLPEGVEAKSLFELAQEKPGWFKGLMLNLKNKMDHNGDGKINGQDFIDKAIDWLDKNGDGSINFGDLKGHLVSLAKQFGPKALAMAFPALAPLAAMWKLGNNLWKIGKGTNNLLKDEDGNWFWKNDDGSVTPAGITGDSFGPGEWAGGDVDWGEIGDPAGDMAALRDAGVITDDQYNAFMENPDAFFSDAGPGGPGEGPGGQVIDPQFQDQYDRRTDPNYVNLGENMFGKSPAEIALYYNLPTINPDGNFGDGFDPNAPFQGGATADNLGAFGGPIQFSGQNMDHEQGYPDFVKKILGIQEGATTGPAADFENNKMADYPPWIQDILGYKPPAEKPVTPGNTVPDPTNPNPTTPDPTTPDPTYGDDDPWNWDDDYVPYIPGGGGSPDEPYAP